ncbi:HesA/MoeB/ThiF family protein [Pelagibacterium halotolerans]|uniref:HesA/MoeB/ThiF family protein n=1 Tax=Pelagibacterium halotolerans TaxID=531813 RepID=UPI0038505FFD
MNLSSEEIRRYARHIVLKDMGGAGQQKLKSTHVLVVGAGGLGSPVIAYLAGAGIGSMTILDPDAVDVSNLQRQVIYSSADAGLSKAERAKAYARALNPHVAVTAVTMKISADNAAEMIVGHDLVVEGTDSFAAKKAVAAACANARVPLVIGALGQFDGSLTVLAPFLVDAAGKPLPRFEALYPVDPRPEDSPPCEEVGVLNVLPGIVGTMMANEAIKWITEIGEPLLGRLLIYSARSGETRVMRYH